METYKYKKIGNFEIVRNFNKLSINPVATKRKVSELIESSDLKKEFESIRKDFKDTPKPDTKSETLAYNKKMNKLANKLDVLKRRLKNEAKELYKNNHVFFPMRKSERAADNIEELKTKFVSLTPNQKLLTSGEIIDDYKGTLYIIRKNGKLKRQKIKKLGENIPDNSIDMTPELEFEMKLDAMTSEEIQVIKNQDLSGIKQLAICKKSELEFDGMDTPSAIVESRKGYEADVEIIDAKYKKWLV